VGLPLDALGIESNKARTLRLTDRLLSNVWPTMFGYQFIVVATPVRASGPHPDEDRDGQEHDADDTCQGGSLVVVPVNSMLAGDKPRERVDRHGKVNDRINQGNDAQNGTHRANDPSGGTRHVTHLQGSNSTPPRGLYPRQRVD